MYTMDIGHTFLFYFYLLSAGYSFIFFSNLIYALFSPLQMHISTEEIL